MRKDYRFLIGQRFAFAGEIYVVQDLTAADDRTYVQANASTAEARSTGGLETFSLSDVIQSLLVDEEIELFNPNFLAAR